MIRRAALALALAGGLADVSGAEPPPATVTDLAAPKDPAWQLAPAPPAGLTLVAHAPHLTLTVVRVAIGNPAAYRAAERGAYLDALEDGLRTRLPGYRRRRREVTSVGGAPTLTIEAGRQGGATVIARWRLRRTSTTAATVEAAPDARASDLARARAALHDVLP